MNPLLITLFCLLSISSFGQYKSNDQWQIGVGLEANFSSLYNHGITPSLTIGNDCHHIEIGPRIGFHNFAGRSSRNPQNFVLDAAYGINLFSKVPAFTLSGVFKLEFAYNKTQTQWYYTPPNPEDDMGIYEEVVVEGSNENPFTVQETHKNKTFMFYLGISPEIALSKNFYLKGIAASGVGFTMDHINFTDLDYGTHIAPRMRINGIPSLNFILSAGIGYRFN